MTGKNSHVSMLAVLLLVLSSLTMLPGSASEMENAVNSNNNIEHPFLDVNVIMSDAPQAITVSESDPFYSLIAIPLAINYDDVGTQHVIPLYVEDLGDPSSAVTRAKEDIGIASDLIIGDSATPKQWSLSLAEMFWDESSTVMIIEENFEGYSLGVVATPMACYLNIPIIVTEDVDVDVIDTLLDLNCEEVIVCGDLTIPSGFDVVEYTDVDEIVQECVTLIEDKFSTEVDYITMANPLDTTPPEVLDSITYEFTNTLGSLCILPSQAVGSLLNGMMDSYELEVPSDYKYCNFKIHVTNVDSQNVEELSDSASFMLSGPDGNRLIFGSTAGGIPVTDETGSIIEDKNDFEMATYDAAGTYTFKAYGNWFGATTGTYAATVTVEKLSGPIVPLMDNLSSFAPYHTAYHKGVVFAKEEFAFSADDDVMVGGEPVTGVTQPGSNYDLIEPSNQHTLNVVHAQLMGLLYRIAGISEGELEDLHAHFTDDPLYISVCADPTMVPMYFYYNPDGLVDSPGADFLGFALPSDFLYADVDPDPTDVENDTLSYWPLQENVIARTTGRDTEDLSALIARTIYYNELLDDLGDWKNRALVQTGCGLEFQNLPILTKLSQYLYSGRGEPTKFFTGESTFINLRLKEKMSVGYEAESTFALASQLEGYSEEGIKLIKNANILNRLFFPAKLVYLLNSDEAVVGGEKQVGSNLIFTFAHGSYNLFEHGDVFINSRGFPLVSMFTRIYPSLGSRLSEKGTFNIRAVDTMEYGPSVIFVESCITGRSDGIHADNLLSQTFIHAGVNAYIGSTRVTADPGYLEPRPLPSGWGLGILGLLNATSNLLLNGEYPDTHFGAVIAEDFIDDLIQNDSSVGLALRDAKNKFLEKDANSTFLWTPPLSIALTGIPELDGELEQLRTPQPVANNERTRTLDKKYVCLHEFTLYGDPAFNPYQPVNNG